MKKKGAVIGVCIADAFLIIISICLYLRLDRTAPIISFEENNIVYTEGMDTSLLLEGVTATDDRDGDVSDTLLIEKISNTAKGDVLVTYAALDGSDNVEKAAQIFPAKMNTGSQETSHPEETETATDINTSEAETETQTELKNEGSQEEDGRENEAPVLQLSRDVLTVKAGAESVNWNDCIQSLSDDKDDRAQLFSNLVMEGTVDLQKPGEYPVTIYTRDSEGTESKRRSVTVRVEE